MSKKLFIGVAWPYANGSLHLGHIAGCYLPADIFARFHRLIGNDVLMVSGSDEHGTPITITAEREKTTPQTIVDRYNKEHTENMRAFGISFDLFTRTTTKNHTTTVQEIFTTLYNKNYIYEKSIEQYYCITCQRFLPDRYIEGTCPHCHDEDARGDQCDTCGKLLDPTELVAIRCKLCGSTPEKQITNHLFFTLSKFEKKLLTWLKDKKQWKSNVIKFTNNWLKNGLHDRAITRDIEWGVKVPIPGYEQKRIYVWFDAVIGYLSASKQWAQDNHTPEKWQEWWENPTAKHYYFLAKDNIPFHSIIWPAILMGYNEHLNLPYDIPANEYLCLSGEQFSKSRCVAIWVPDILKQYDPDAIRYYLSINMPENKDANWTWTDFIAKNNDELVGAYGNFIHRVITFTHKNFNIIPSPNALTEMDKEAHTKISQTLIQVHDALNHCNFKKGLRSVMTLAQYGNYYFDQMQPWQLVKEDKDRCATVLHTCLQIVQALAVAMTPYLPFSSKKIWHLLGFTKDIQSWQDATIPLKVGSKLDKPNPLFKKLELEECIMQEDPFGKLDLRVAEITDVQPHPNADKLYVIEINLGPLGKRTIVAGMRPHYLAEELTGKHIVVILNLKPAKIRGIESKGMLLAATDATGIVSLLNPKNSQPGAEVYIEGIPREPVPELDFNEFLQITITIDPRQQAVYNNKPLQTKTNKVYSDKPVSAGAKIS
ncbi:MAG: methionine--tRNA ligase [Candidatus Thermoplasmatota archaeon]|nr:methionine--tRNA ligase [Candidatus Thermoplasmatota archaeon]MBU1940406.1 methionine--tRNA ligase [Candidatus Thermoplasmatota archaeon]